MRHVLAVLLAVTLGCAANAVTKEEWEAQLSADSRKDPAFAYVREDVTLPRVLIIGDSISIGYTPEVRELLSGKANVLRVPENAGPTSRGVANIDKWLGQDRWDVIHFNFGLHDIKHMIGDKVDMAGPWQVSAEQYEKNLEALVAKLKATGAKLIFASTTPVPEGVTMRVPGEEKKVNEIAERVMKKNDVPVNDLYGYVLPLLATYQQPKNVHFTPDGYAFLGQKVAEEILKAMEGN